MNLIKQINLLVLFLLEIALVIIVGYWGFQQGETLTTKYILALILPAILITIWGIWAAPKSKRRLKNPIRTVFKLLLFSIGFFFCIDTGNFVFAWWFGSIIIVNVGLAFLFSQDF